MEIDMEKKPRVIIYTTRGVEKEREREEKSEDLKKVRSL